MKNFAQITMIGMVAVAALGILPINASADYAVTVLKNNTNAYVAIEIQWGDGEWQRFQIEPGRTFSTWRNNYATAPDLKIRFDADPGPGYDQVRYRLRKYRSETTIFNNGETERFQIRPNGRIDLFSAR